MTVTYYSRAATGTDGFLPFYPVRRAPSFRASRPDRHFPTIDEFEAKRKEKEREKEETSVDEFWHPYLVLIYRNGFGIDNGRGSMPGHYRHHRGRSSRSEAEPKGETPQPEDEFGGLMLDEIRQEARRRWRFCGAEKE